VNDWQAPGFLHWNDICYSSLWLIREIRMTRAAFACWDRRIAPVFDTTRELHVVEVHSGKIVEETKENLTGNPSFGSALRLAELRVDVLVCGAISRQLHALITAYGIRVIPFMAGELDRVVAAWVQGDLESETFTMPGCGSGFAFRKRRHRRMRAGEGRRARGGNRCNSR
jgi:predicted Fe-Mo cluster-binding NifX family protein